MNGNPPFRERQRSKRCGKMFDFAVKMLEEGKQEMKIPSLFAEHEESETEASFSFHLQTNYDSVPLILAFYALDR